MHYDFLNKQGKVKFLSFEIVKDILKLFGSILLVGLMLVKVSAFHAYDHHNSSENDAPSCEICLIVFESQQSQVLLHATAEIIVPFDLIKSRENIFASDFQISKTSSGGSLFGRPPPAIL